jgi:hypothetical protein
MEDQECKCYNVLSSKALPHKGQVIDILASFLKKDKECQLNFYSSSSPSLTEEEGNEEGDDHDHIRFQQLDRDFVREKASWNELRRWANELLEEGDDEQNLSKKRIRKPIEDWKEQGQQSLVDNNDKDRFNQEGGEAAAADQHKRHRSFSKSENQADNVEEDNRMISKGLIKVEAMESTGRAEVSIVGRSATQSFEDHIQSDMDDIEDTTNKKFDSIEAKRARKKEKKQAKKAKKEAKKMMKESKKKRKRQEVAVKLEE